MILIYFKNVSLMNLSFIIIVIFIIVYKRRPIRVRNIIKLVIYVDVDDSHG